MSELTSGSASKSTRKPTDEPMGEPASKPTDEPKSLKVDMIATARNVQWTADSFLGHGSVKLVAPAKVNLFLGIGPRREDGYHDVANIMHSLALHDTLYLNSIPIQQGSADMRYLAGARRLTENGVAGGGTMEGTETDTAARGTTGSATDGTTDGISIGTSTDAATDDMASNASASSHGELSLPPHLAIAGPQDNLLVMIDCVDKGGVGELDVPTSENIVYRAVHELACEVGYAREDKVVVRLEKNIPHQGGLGGGSSDAAAALVGIAKLWGVSSAENPVPSSMEAVARRLGSDVAFFLHGGCALLDGAGERFVRALVPRKDPVLLIKPPGGVSTATAYARFDENPVAIGEDLLQMVASVSSAGDVVLFNNLTDAAESILPELADVRMWAESREGVRDVLLCGSGATTCVFVDSFSTACKLASEAQLQGWWARATMFSSLKATTLPA